MSALPGDFLYSMRFQSPLPDMHGCHPALFGSLHPGLIGTPFISASVGAEVEVAPSLPVHVAIRNSNSNHPTIFSSLNQRMSLRLRQAVSGRPSSHLPQNVGTLETAQHGYIVSSLLPAHCPWLNLMLRSTPLRATSLSLIVIST